MKKLEIRSQLDIIEDKGLDCSIFPSLTQQEFVDEQDINNIVKKAHVGTGLLQNQERLFADLSKLPDLAQAEMAQKQLEAAWSQLPEAAQQKFQSMDQLMDFLSDQKNTEEAQKLGFLQDQPKPDIVLTTLTELNDTLKSFKTASATSKT